jgi:hypothetical protein
VVMMIFRPEGIIREKRRVYRLRIKERGDHEINP